MGLIVNTITAKWTKQYALNGLLSAVLLGFMASYKLPYYLDGKLINLLALGSLTSLVISMFISTNLVASLKQKMNFNLSNLLSISIASAIDGLVMSAFFTVETNFTLSKIAGIAIREVSWKLIYAMIFTIAISYVMHFLNSKKQVIIH
jgi:hypothetical protein